MEVTPEDFAALLRLLGPDRETAAQAYEKIRRKLIRYFEWRGCDVPDELADETFNRVARRVSDILNTENPHPYFYGVAHRVFQEWLRRKSSQAKVIREVQPVTTVAYEDEPEDRRLESLRHCLSLLPEGQRTLLLRYHQGEHHKQARKLLCQELGIEMNALRIRVHRLRRRIESCVEERLR
jgi:RNA polymerase sigma factor (sigma-70 family)